MCRCTTSVSTGPEVHAIRESGKMYYAFFAPQWKGASDAATLRYVAQFAARLKGRSAFEIEWLRSAAAPEIATGGRSAACALSALEQCLWDIIGQALNVPVYDLFGGALRTATPDLTR